MFTGGFVRHVFDKKTCRQERNTELLPPLPLTLLKAHNFYDKFTNCDPLSDMKSKKKLTPTSHLDNSALIATITSILSHGIVEVSLVSPQNFIQNRDYEDNYDSSDHTPH